MGRAGFQNGTPDNVTISDSSTEILSATQTASLSHLVLTNDSDETIYVAYGAPAEMNKGIVLNPQGGFFEFYYPNIPRGVSVNGICSSGSKNLSFHYGD